ncbi:hypothetical protein ACGFWH_26650, partial [Streptomyces goshikiensis]
MTRSRSVTHLAAPAFAGAVMGRQILGAIPVERRVLLFAAGNVASHPHLEGRTIAGPFSPLPFWLPRNGAPGLRSWHDFLPLSIAWLGGW